MDQQQNLQACGPRALTARVDPISDSTGHAAISHPGEYQAIIADRQRKGVNFKYGENDISFCPNLSGGAIGNEILLPSEFFRC